MIKYQPVHMQGVCVRVNRGVVAAKVMGEPFFSRAGRALEFHQARAPLAGLCRQQQRTHRAE